MIYFDSAATSMPSDTASKAFAFAAEKYANPSSVHSGGIEASKLLTTARDKIAATLGAKPSEIYFVPSGTFANNAAIIGASRAKARKGRHIILSDSEHPSVHNAALQLQKEGFELSFVQTKGGAIDKDELVSLIRDDTVLVSIMLANNETGALYDIPSLSKAVKAKSKDIIFHCDAVQGYLKTPFSVNSLGVDLLSVSAHKVHAFKGSGALFIRSGIRVEPIIYGGGQESGICSGTESVPLIYSFAECADEQYGNLKSNIEKIKTLYEYAEEKLEAAGVKVNTPAASTYCVLSATLPDIKSEVMLNHLSSFGIYISAGSACSSHAKSNRILTAYGLTPRQSECTIRISFSEYNTKDEVDILANAISSGISSLAKMRK